MTHHRAAKASSSGMKPLEDEEGQLVVGVPQPKASDVARQIGAGLNKLADVIDECPPLAKLFDGDLLQRRFQEVYQVPSALMEDVDAEPRSEAAVSDGQDEATPPGQKPSEGAAAAAAAAAGGTSSSSSSSGRNKTRSAAEEGGKGEIARSISSPPNRMRLAWSSPDPGTSGRRGKRGTGLGVEDEKAWPGLEQALKASELEYAAAAGNAEGTGAAMNGTGVVRSRRLANQGDKEVDSSAQERLTPSLSVRPALGFPLPRPSRRAAAHALYRMPSLPSSGAPSVGLSPPAVSAGPRKQSSAASRRVEMAAEVAARGSEVERADNAKVKEKEAVGGGKGKADGKNNKQAKTTEATSSDPARGRRGAGTPASKECGQINLTTVNGTRGGGRGGSGDVRGRARGAGAGAMKGGGRKVPNEATGGGSTTRRQTDAVLLGRLDARVFRFVPAGECEEKECMERDKTHCHRGPGCDCTSISSTHLWPAEVKSMLRHQERHLQWNTEPAFGKRVLVEFSGGNYYPGTINTEGKSAKDLNHSKGRWGVLFDDCTRDRFEDGATDVMVSNHPRLTSISEKLRDYYLGQENGRRLLIGVEVVAEGHGKSEDEEGLGNDEDKSKANTNRTRMNRSGGEKRKHRTSSEYNKPGTSSPDTRARAGGRDVDGTRKQTLKAGTKARHRSFKPMGDAGDDSGSKKKQKHAMASVAAIADEALVEEEEEEEAEWDDGGSGYSASGFASEDKRGDRSKKGAGSKSRFGKRKKGDRYEEKRFESKEEDLVRPKTGAAEQPKTRRGVVGEGFYERAAKNASNAGGGSGGEGERGPKVAIGWEEVTGGGRKHETVKKPRAARQPQRQLASDSFHPRSSGSTIVTRGVGTVAAKAPGAKQQSRRGPDGIVPRAQDNRDARAVIVAEGGGGDARDHDDTVDGDDFEPGWKSPPPPSPARTPVGGRRRRLTRAANVVPVNPVSASTSTAELTTAQVPVSGGIGT